MLSWRKLRILLLIINFTGILIVLVITIIQPVQSWLPTTSHAFPNKISLPQWEQVESGKLSEKNLKQPEIIAQKHYRYVQNNLSLDIEMRYLTLIKGEKFIKKYLEITSPVEVRLREGIGYYGIGVDKQEAFLSTCMNSGGITTFTDEQFEKNQYFSILEPQSLISWLLGRRTSIDKHCMWAHLSVPLGEQKPEFAYQLLEKAWFSWYQQWNSHLSER
ncbi:MAG: cyanoexosortase A system-associated protein [Mastigocoleus sp. MO_167.B18]|nr:cyanoexosortase A system-associated protein [Mastigocoleus sp. MO_167.B18]